MLDNANSDFEMMMFNKAAIFLLSSLCLWQQPAQAAIPASERAALIALYNATNGAGWNDNGGWLGAAGTECTWHGVYCGQQGASVISLYLQGNQISGAIPAELGQLGQLQHLDLSNNRLGGAIPAELGQLSQLQRLILYGNQIGGVIPTELGQLSQLIYLYLGGNQIGGAIPSELGQLSQLEELALDFNLLGGTIPAELGQLSRLRNLSLEGNQIGGVIPTELGQLSQLTYLYLGGNELGGAIPAELGQLSQLKYLDVGDNQLGGAIPAELGQLGQLQHLNLSFNRLGGTIPAELGQLNNLAGLGLGINFLTNIAAQISQLTGLGWLNVSQNCLSESTLDPAVVAFLNEKEPGWQGTQRASCASALPTVMKFDVGAGTIRETGLRFTVTLSEPIPEGYGVFVNFDDQHGGWYDVGEDGWHLALAEQDNGVYVADYNLEVPGLRFFRAGIFALNGDGDGDDTLVGSYTAPQVCLEPSCLAAMAIPKLYGDPAVIGNGSELFKNVDVSNGNYHLAVTDMSVDGKGPAFAFDRAYNSLALRPWTFGYEVRASFVAGANRREVTVGPREDGHTQFFYKDMDGLWYTLNPGNFDRLIENEDGIFVLYTQGNRLYRFEDPTGAMAGRLRSIEDRLGNALTFRYSASGNHLIGAEDANERQYSITRDGTIVSSALPTSPADPWNTPTTATA